MIDLEDIKGEVFATKLSDWLYPHGEVKEPFTRDNLEKIFYVLTEEPKKSDARNLTKELARFKLDSFLYSKELKVADGKDAVFLMLTLCELRTRPLFFMSTVVDWLHVSNIEGIRTKRWDRLGDAILSCKTTKSSKLIAEIMGEAR